jgi:hypothetical protein
MKILRAKKESIIYELHKGGVSSAYSPPYYGMCLDRPWILLIILGAFGKAHDINPDIGGKLYEYRDNLVSVLGGWIFLFSVQTKNHDGFTECLCAIRLGPRIAKENSGAFRVEWGCGLYKYAHLVEDVRVFSPDAVCLPFMRFPSKLDATDNERAAASLATSVTLASSSCVYYVEELEKAVLPETTQVYTRTLVSHYKEWIRNK